MKSMKWWAWLICALLLPVLLGCSSGKKVGESCERDSQCDGLLVCFKDPPDQKKGKCIKAAEARTLYNKRKEEKK